MKPLQIIEDLKRYEIFKDNNFEIKVFTKDNSNELITPIYIGIDEITHLGLYEVYGKKWWVVKADKPLPEQPKEIEKLESIPERHKKYVNPLFIEIIDKLNELITRFTALERKVR